MNHIFKNHFDFLMMSAPLSSVCGTVYFSWSSACNQCLNYVQQPFQQLEHLNELLCIDLNTATTRFIHHITRIGRPNSIISSTKPKCSWSHRQYIKKHLAALLRQLADIASDFFIGASCLQTIGKSSTRTARPEGNWKLPTLRLHPHS